jgi:hypothetical protein
MILRLPMKRFNLKYLKWALVASLTVELVGCAARYGTKRRGGGAAVTPQPASEGNADPSKETDSKLGPTAGVEVVVDGQVVNQVPIGKVATIRPTKDTKDGDDAAKDGCPHPGIIHAAYVIGGQTNVSAKSSDGCDSLEIQHKFDTAGTLLIELNVTSNENENAKASASISVVNGDSPNTAVTPSLRIQVVPLETEINQTVDFEAVCTGKSPAPEINWDFADGSSAQGANTKHAYQQAGSYHVKAKCKIDGEELTASATVVVKSNIKTITGDNSGSGSGTGGSGSGTGSSGSDASTSSSGKGTADGSSSTGGSGKGTADGSSSTGGSGSNTTGGSGSETSGSSGGSKDGNTSGTVPDEDDNGGGTAGQNPGQNPSQSPNQN